MNRLALILCLGAWVLLSQGSRTVGRVLEGNPSNYRGLLRALKAGDTLNLVAGSYDRLEIVELNGEPDAWITVSGPISGAPAVISGRREFDTVSIENSSYVSIENLRIDSRGIPGAFGISTKGREGNVSHHIRVEGNVLVGQGGGQQTDGISTKTPTWGWIIRYNQILGAGTGIYLGDSDGNQPFVGGLIENNLVQDSIGYNLEIKNQNSLPDVPGMPTGPSDTVIRNNVFIKDDRPSPDGDRPNVILGSFPATGGSALSMYEVYGNYFIHNHREALLQASGRVSIHDNVFVDGPYDYPAIVLMAHQGSPVKVAHLYNNTIYTSSKGIYFGTRATIDDAVIGNLVFGSVPVSGQIMRQADNVVDWPSNAEKYVVAPTFDRQTMDFYPLAGKCQGSPLDLSMFHTGTDYARDFNGSSKVLSKGAVVFRGAYAGEGINPGWLPRQGIKPPPPPVAAKRPVLVGLSPASGRPGATVKLELFGENFRPEDRVEISGTGVQLVGVEVAGASRITVSAKLGTALPASNREVSVLRASDKSNALRFRIQSTR